MQNDMERQAKLLSRRNEEKSALTKKVAEQQANLDKQRYAAFMNTHGQCGYLFEDSRLHAAMVGHYSMRSCRRRSWLLPRAL